MRILYIVAVFVCGCMVVNGQAPEWEWAKSAGGDNNDISTCIGTDASGNVYVAGDFFTHSITFGGVTLNSVGEENVFIVKYDAAGNVLWAKEGSGRSSRVYINGLSVNAQGDVSITGYFDGDILYIGNDTLSGTNNDNTMFVIRCDSIGNTIWKNTASGIETNVSGIGISNDLKGNTYVTGTAFGLSFSFSDTVGLGIADVFLVKYDSIGNAVWAKNAGGNGLCTDAVGNIYALGEGVDFLAKYDSAGNMIWTQTLEAIAGSAFTDAYNNIYVTGTFGDTATVGNDTLISVGSGNMLIVKYDPQGNILWAKSATGSGNDIGTGLSIDASGDIYVTGYYSSPTIAFGKDTLTNFSSNDSNSIFIVKYDSSGNIIWATSPKGYFSDANYLGRNNSGVANVSVDTKGDVYVAGQFSSPTIIFGSDTLVNDTNNGTNDVYIAKFGTPTSTNVSNINTAPTLMTVYPNPTSGNVHFSGVQTRYTLQIYDVLGETISSSTVDRDNYAVNLSGKAKGMYFYRVEEGGGVVGKGKVVVE